MVRTLKEVEAEKDCLYAQKKLEEVEKELKETKICWFENYHSVESKLKMIIRKVLNITVVVGKQVSKCLYFSEYVVHKYRVQGMAADKSY